MAPASLFECAGDSHAHLATQPTRLQARSQRRTVAVKISLLAVLSGVLGISSTFVAPLGGHRWGAAGTAPAAGRVALRATNTLERPKQASQWRLQVGHAIDVLRTDIQGLLQDEDFTPDTSIYSQDLVVLDARLPSFRLNGLASYEQLLSTLKWSVRTACDRSRMEILAMQPPVNNELYVRWRLHLWPKDVLASARNFLAPALGAQSILLSSESAPLIVDGYSRYEFDSWTAEIVKHTVDITNPPMYLADLLRGHSGAFAWSHAPPVGVGLGLPNVMRGSQDVGSGLLPGVSAWTPSLPQGCEDDFECNGGRANYPLQCCELPLIGKFCCQPPEVESAPERRDPAYVPIPVPVDPWH